MRCWATSPRSPQQVKGLINDNPNLNHVLEQLRTISDILVQRKDDLAKGLVEVGGFLPSLNEAIASGPFFKVVLHNLASGPDPAAVRRCRVQEARHSTPKNFWRSAGLPAYRFPDPNGTRFPNGAPPPAPQVLEGTPDHPGPAVPPGSPCSYTPRGRRAAAAVAIRCPARARPSARSAAPAFPAPIDVATSPPNPDGLPPTPGIPIAGRPGQPAPDVPGTPVPLPADAPPGARTETAGTGRPDAAAVDVRAGPAAGPAGTSGARDPAAGPVDQPGRNGRQRRDGR